MQKNKNRYGDLYWFEPVSANVYTIKGDLKYWRWGGQEGEDTVNESDLGFVDPSGGPYISMGFMIEGRPVRRISAVNGDLYFEVKSRD
jgi:hypothetical protein